MTKQRLSKLAVAVLLAGGIAISVPAVAGGIPTFDAAAVAQATQQFMQMLEQTQNQLKQLEQMKKQVEAMKGSRNMGKIARTEAQELLPDEWKDIYKAAKKQAGKDNKDLLSGKNYDYNAQNDRLIKQFDMTMKAIKDSELRMKNIRALIDQVDRTQDVKAAADLQNRIAGEQAKIQQNQVNLDTMARLYEMQKEIDEVSFEQRNKCARAPKHGWKIDGCY